MISQHLPYDWEYSTLFNKNIYGSFEIVTREDCSDMGSLYLKSLLSSWVQMGAQGPSAALSLFQDDLLNTKPWWIDILQLTRTRSRTEETKYCVLRLSQEFDG